MNEHMTLAWLVQELVGPEGDENHLTTLSLEELRDLRERLSKFTNPKDTIVSYDGREWPVREVTDRLTKTIENVVTMNFGYHVMALVQELEKTREIEDVGVAIHMIVIAWIGSAWERHQIPQEVADSFADAMTVTMGNFAGVVRASPNRDKPTDHVVAECEYLQAVMEERRLVRAVEDAARNLSRTMHLPDLSKLLRKLDTARMAQALPLAKMKNCANPD